MAGVWSIVVPQLSELTNLVANPSFETNTAGWTAVGGSVTQGIGYCTSGIAGGSVVADGNNDGVYYGTVALTTGVTYTFGVDFKGLTGKSYKMYFADTSANVKGTANTFTCTSASYWQREYVSWACDSTASYRLYIIKNDFADDGSFYIDAVSVIATSSEITYFDGDTPNCRWSGVAHGSTSVSNAQARNVGVVTDLQDYNLRVLTMDGVGTAQSSHQVSQYAIMPGAGYNGHKVQPRYITLTNAVYGTSLENLHSKRKDIVDLFKHDLTAGDQPIILRYTGANASRPVEITCYLLQEIGQFDAQKIQRNAIQLVCYDPFFYDLYTDSNLITQFSAAITQRYFAAKRNGAWTGITPSAVTDPGAGIIVRDIEIKGSYLSWQGPPQDNGDVPYGQITNEKIYVSGYYLNWNGTAASDYICYYDPAAATWNAIEAGTNGYVRSMSIAPNGYLYACGEFTQIGDTAANRIAYWDGSNWNAMGDGFGGTAFDVLVGNDGKVYACGNDSTIGGVAGAAYVAYWDGSAWQAMSTGISAVAYVLSKDNSGNIYIGGQQTGRVTKWDGSAFTALTVTGDYICWGLKVAPNGTVYAGIAGGEYIIQWNGQSWVSMGGGITAGNFTYSMDIDADGVLWVGGDFSAVGGLTVRGLACWNGYSWVHPDIQLPASTIVYTVKCNGNDIYLGFDTATDTSTYYSATSAITNNGTARVYPIITVKRSGGTSASLRYLRNETTGATIYMDYAMQDGETVTFDFREGQRSVTSSYYGDIWRAVLRGSQFADFYLLPGSNTISRFVNYTGAETVLSYIYYTGRHESIDGAAV